MELFMKSKPGRFPKQIATWMARRSAVMYYIARIACTGVATDKRRSISELIRLWAVDLRKRQNLEGIVIVGTRTTILSMSVLSASPISL